jgi:hypothetical protein
MVLYIDINTLVNLPLGNTKKEAARGCLCSKIFFLSEELEYRLRCGICLSEHCSTGLHENLVFHELNHLFSHVCVAYAAFSGLHVFIAS